MYGHAVRVRANAQSADEPLPLARPTPYDEGSPLRQRRRSHPTSRGRDPSLHRDRPRDTSPEAHAHMCNKQDPALEHSRFLRTTQMCMPRRHIRLDHSHAPHAHLRCSHTLASSSVRHARRRGKGVLQVLDLVVNPRQLRIKLSSRRRTRASAHAAHPGTGRCHLRDRLFSLERGLRFRALGNSVFSIIKKLESSEEKERR